MKIKTLSDYPGLIGQILRRHEARELRRFRERHSRQWPTIAAAVAGTITGTAFGVGWNLWSGELTWGMGLLSFATALAVSFSASFWRAGRHCWRRFWR